MKEMFLCTYSDTPSFTKGKIYFVEVRPNMKLIPTNTGVRMFLSKTHTVMPSAKEFAKFKKFSS